MLWVLKRTISMRRFFWAPKTYVETDGLENIYNITIKNFGHLNLCFLSWKCPLTFTSSVLQTKILVIVVSLSAYFSFLYFHFIEIAAKSLVKVVVKGAAAENNDNITLKNYFSYFSSKTNVVGSQKKRLDEAILLSTSKMCFDWWVRKKDNFMIKNYFSTKTYHVVGTL